MTSAIKRDPSASEIGRKVQTFSAVDLGTSRVACVWAEGPEVSMPGGVLPRLLFAEESPCFGLREGAVADARRARESVCAAIAEVRRRAGARIRSVAVGVSGLVKLAAVRGGGSVRSFNGCVAAADVRRLRSRLPQTPEAGKTPVHVFDGPYRVGGQREVDNPVGLFGRRLEMERVFVSLPSDQWSALNQVVRATARPLLMAVDPVSASLGATTEDERNLGVAVLDFGAGGFRAAFWEKNRLRQIHVVGTEAPKGSGFAPVAAGGMSTLIAAAAQHFRLPPSTAERVIRKEGVVGQNTAAARGGKKIRAEALDGLHSVEFSTEDLREVLEANLNPALRFMRDGVSGFNPGHAGGVVLTGGAARMRGLPELVSRHFGGAPIRMGVPRWELCCDLPPALRGPGGCSVAGLLHLTMIEHARKKDGFFPSLRESFADAAAKVRAAFW